MRRTRTVVPGCAHHVTQRGNRKANIFRDTEDRFHYMRLLREHSEHHHVSIWVYTLMTNHIHAIVVPESDIDMSAAFRDTHSVYAQWFNRKYGLSGHLWQGRFYSCALGDSQLWTAVRYVERNPVRAGIVARAEDYEWSSARAHVYGQADELLTEGLPLIGSVGNWSEWLKATDVESELNAIRKSTARDIPFGDANFVERLETAFGRPLRPQKPGPKK